VFVTVGSYFLGIGFGAIATWWSRGRPERKGSAWFDNVRAFVTLIAVALTIVVQLSGWQERIPYGAKLEVLPLALMLFYFGSR